MGAAIEIGGLQFDLEELSGIREESTFDKLAQFYADPHLNYRLSGVKVRDLIVSKLAQENLKFESAYSVKPGLGIIQVGHDAASDAYANAQKRYAEKANFELFFESVPEHSKHRNLMEKIAEFNNNANIHAYIVEFPLPDTFDEEAVRAAIDIRKDADCFHPYNEGLFYTSNEPGILPATAFGVEMILEAYGIPMTKQEENALTGETQEYALLAAIAGRGNVTGKPIARTLEREFSIACLLLNSGSNTPSAFRSGVYDILIGATTKPYHFTAEDVPLGTKLIIDVGTFRNPKPDGIPKIVGNFRPEAYEKAKFYVPSPGGTGPCTVAGLLANAHFLAKLSIFRHSEPNFGICNSD